MFCVRYRYDEAKGKRFTTVELIVDEADWKPIKRPVVQEVAGRTKLESSGKEGNKKLVQIPEKGPSQPQDSEIVRVRIDWGEFQLGQSVKSSGGQWNAKGKYWEIPLAEVKKLGIENRIIKQFPKSGEREN
ncbi:MAG: hypothetical protein WA705_05490 [Candidatus Ozemobacteraceae bacterium]